MTDIFKTQDVLKKVNQYAEKHNMPKISKVELTEKVTQLIEKNGETKTNLQKTLKKIYNNPTLILPIPTPPPSGPSGYSRLDRI